MDPLLPQRRAGRLASIMGGLFALVALRLVWLQVVRKPFLSSRADREQLGRQEVPGRRGGITDRNGQVLAASVESGSVLVTRVQPARRAAVAKALASALGLKEAGLKRRMAAGRAFYAARGIRPEALARLKALELPELQFTSAIKRVYPQGRLAAHVLGCTDVDGRGLEGVELRYQKVLGGEPGLRETVHDAVGRPLENQSRWLRRPSDGRDLQLTLDASLQHIAERELAKAYAKFRAKGAALVLMDPRSGEILALASVPTYDPAEPARAGAEARRNRALADTFEPGSTFKTVTAAQALELGVVKPETPIDCQGGRAQFFGRTVRDHGDDHMGVVPFREVLAQSSNVGSVTVALKYGPQALFQGMSGFGYGQPTYIDLPGEAVGKLRPLEQWTPGSMAAVPFGQEFSCNLMRVLVTYAAVANGGKLVRPHVVRKVSGDLLSDSAADPRFKERRVVSEAVCRQLTDILQGVVDHGTGVSIALPGYTIAGKTGTAQKFDQATHRYSMQASVSTFVGYAPAQDPAFVAAVMLDEPKGMTLGGWTAGPVFREVVSAALSAHRVAPEQKVMQAQLASAKAAMQSGDKSKAWTSMYKRGTEALELGRVAVPELRGMEEAAARAALAKLGLRAFSRGSGRVVSQLPKAGETVLETSTVQLSLSPGGSAAASSNPRLLAGLGVRR